MMKRKIKFFDLTKQYKSISKEINSKVIKVIRQGQYILGPNVNDFEKKFSKKFSTKYAVTCNSGTDSLIFALKAININQGDEVITTPFRYFSTVESIIQCGAKPVFVDIDPLTFNINTNLIENALTKKTKAIMPVHIFGQSSNMIHIRKIANKYKLKVIEDCAQSIGATFKKIQTGTFGDLGCFSFFPTKNLGAIGDAGITITSNKQYAEKLKKLRNHGGIVRNEHEMLGYNSRMDEIQAAILSAKLKYLEIFNRKRNQIAKLYSSMIQNKLIRLPYKNKENYHVYHQFTLCVNNRSRFIKHLTKYKVPYGIYYPKPLYKQKALKGICSSKKMPITENITKQCISIPIYPELDNASIEYISTTINKYK